MELKEALAAKAVPVEAALREYQAVREPEQLYRAMAHIPLAGGKRLRPMCLLEECFWRASCPGSRLDQCSW